jgi:hypothetical protein
MIMGEYRIEVRDNSVTEVWRPSVDADPVPDHNDMATETAAQKQRELVTRWNRETGWYKYRTIYVPADQGPDPLTERIVHD